MPPIRPPTLQLAGLIRTLTNPRARRANCKFLRALRGRFSQIKEPTQTMSEREPDLHQEDDDCQKDAVDLMFRITRSYLARRGSWRDLDLRSRIVVNGILSALEREHLRFPTQQL
jgi:hypothetical protein